MLILGRGRLVEGQLCSAGLRNGLGQDPTGLESLARARNWGKNLQLIYNLPSSSILLGNPPDPKNFHTYMLQSNRNLTHKQSLKQWALTDTGERTKQKASLPADRHNKFQKKNKYLLVIGRILFCFLFKFRTTPAIFFIIIHHTIKQQTLWLHDLCIQIFTQKGSEFYQF